MEKRVLDGAVRVPAYPKHPPFAKPRSLDMGFAKGRCF
jgi:hypothetical protein